MDNFIKSVLEEKHGYLSKMLDLERERQEKNIELIASENYASDAVRAAMASCLTNKYAEGLPGRRYYGGCQYIDIIENCCKETWKKVFNTNYAVNVQPHSGSQANEAAYAALLNPGDTILSLDLKHGGHLSHGSPVNFSGKLYDIKSYNVDKNEFIDYYEIANAISLYHPHLVIAGASAYPRAIDFKEIKFWIDEVSRVDYIPHPVYFMVDMAHIAGLVATGDHPSPFGYADIVTTTTHKTLRGPRGGLIFCKPELEAKVNGAVFPGTQGGPLEHIILAKAVCAEECLTDEYKEYISQVVKNARAMAEEFKMLGYKLVTNGTDTHMLLIDLSETHPNISGLQVQEECDKYGITLNRNSVPKDKRSPYHASGLRIGTPAMTTRGWKEQDFVLCAEQIDKIIKNLTSDK